MELLSCYAELCRVESVEMFRFAVNNLHPPLLHLTNF